MVNFILKIIGVYDLLMILVGTFGNLLILIVSIRLFKNNTFLYLAFLSVSDFITLFWWNLNHFVQPFYDIDLQNFNITYCKTMQFFQFTSYHLSGWFLVLLTYERFFSVVVRNWREVYFKTKRALLVAITVIIILVSINFHVLFTFGHIRITNQTEVINNITQFIQVESVECYYTLDTPSSKIMFYWQTVHSCLYSYVPFILIFFSNFLLITILAKKRRHSMAESTNQDRHRSMSRTIIVITFLFIAMTLPGTVMSIFYNQLIQTETGTIILYVGDMINVTYHASNVIILCLSNRKFSSEVKYLLGFKTNKISNNSIVSKSKTVQNSTDETKK